MRRDQDRLHILIASENTDREIVEWRTRLVVQLTEGGIQIDPTWLEALDRERQHIQTWLELIQNLGFRGPLYRLLVAARPPLFIADPSAMRMYLATIAQGDIALEDLGSEGRAVIEYALRE